MSLINKMLKDLENRKSSRTDSFKKSKNINTNKIPLKEKKSSWLKAYGHWVLLIIVVGIVAYYFVPAKKKVVVQPKKIENVSATKLLKKQIADVINTTWQSRSNGGTLTLYLSKVTHYQMKKVSDKNIELTLFDANFSNEKVPTILKSDEVIQSLNIMKLQKNSVIDINLKHPGHVSVIELGQSTNSIRIELNITKPEEKEEPQKDAQSDEKTVVPLTREQLAEIEYNRIMSRMSYGNTPREVNALNRLVRRYPEYERAYLTLATLELAQGHKRQALIFANKGLNLNPTDIDLIMIKGRILLQQGKTMKALAWLDRQSPEFEKFPEYYALKAMAELKAGSYVSAELYYSRLVELDPSRSRWWLGLGLAFEQQKKLREADFAFKRALQTGNLPPALQAYVQAKLAKIWL